MTLSGILLFDLDSTAKVVQYVTFQEIQKNSGVSLATNLVLHEPCIVAHNSLFERLVSGAT